MKESGFNQGERGKKGFWGPLISCICYVCMCVCHCVHVCAWPYVGVCAHAMCMDVHVCEGMCTCMYMAVCTWHSFWTHLTLCFERKCLPDGYAHVCMAVCLCVHMTACANVCLVMFVWQCMHVSINTGVHCSVCICRWWWGMAEVKMPLINEEGLLN